MRFLKLAPVLACLAWAPSALASSPPVQPKDGPGGIGDGSAEIVKRGIGTAGAATYAFFRAGPPAEPRPVVVLLHAWGAVDPVAYAGWIDHLARRGYLVLLPAFQEIGRTRGPDATERAATLVNSALAALAADPAARPDPGRLVYLGHSAGAGIAMNLAAIGRDTGLPNPKLVFAIMAGGIAADDAARGVPLADLGKIDPATEIVTLVGDRDAIPSDRVSRRLLREAREVPPARKLFVRASSDDHGFPALSATLASPGSPKEGYAAADIKLPPDPPRNPRDSQPARPKWSADMVLSGEQTILVQQLTRNSTDTLDYLAFWKTFDMAMDATLAGRDVIALKSEIGFLDMGRWSDGWPVKRLAAETPKVVDETATPVARVAPAPTKMPVTRRR